MRGHLCIALRTPTLPPADRTNCYVLGHEEAVVVDPGSRFEPELDRLRRQLWRLRGQGGRVAAVLVTHHHADHTGGAQTVAREQDAPLAAHPETLARLRLEGVETLVLEEGSELTVAPHQTLRCLHTPGHAPGHLCLLDAGRGVLLTGDMVPGIGTTLVAPPEGDMAAYLASLERLAALEPRLLLPAHGPAVPPGASHPTATAARAIRDLIDHRLWREQRVVEALAGGPVDLWRLTARVYDDLPPLILPLASRGALAHLIKLEREGRAVRSGERWALTA